MNKQDKYTIGPPNTSRSLPEQAMSSSDEGKDNDLETALRLLKNVEEVPGRGLKAKCPEPECGEPGLWVTPSLDSFHCNRCGICGTVSELIALLETQDEDSQTPNRFRILSLDELSALPPVEWLVEGAIPKGGLVCLYGPPGSYKSFVALDLSLSICTKKDWMGLPVRQGRALYIAAEGGSGLKGRAEAWLNQYQVDPPNGFRILPEPVQFLQTGEVEKLLDSLQEKDLDLIVIDTMAKSIVGGDENSAKDVGLLVHHCGMISRATGATVLVIHHTGTSGERERGSSALRGAADTMIRVKGGQPSAYLRCDKQREAPPFADLTFKLVSHGESAFVTPSIGLVESTGGLSPRRQEALESLKASGGSDGLTSAEWQLASKIPASTFQTARKFLVDEGFVHRADGSRGARYTVSPKGDEVLLPTSSLTASDLQHPAGNSLPTDPPLLGEGADVVPEVA